MASILLLYFLMTTVKLVSFHSTSGTVDMVEMSTCILHAYLCMYVCMYVRMCVCCVLYSESHLTLLMQSE